MGIAKNRIKAVLELQGRSQVWLAKTIGKSSNSVNAYVQNRTQPSLELLYKIAEVLNVNPKELLMDNNDLND